MTWSCRSLRCSRFGALASGPPPTPTCRSRCLAEALLRLLWIWDGPAGPSRASSAPAAVTGAVAHRFATWPRLPADRRELNVASLASRSSRRLCWSTSGSRPTSGPGPSPGPPTQRWPAPRSARAPALASLRSPEGAGPPTARTVPLSLDVRRRHRDSPRGLVGAHAAVRPWPSTWRSPHCGGRAGPRGHPLIQESPRHVLAWPTASPWLYGRRRVRRVTDPSAIADERPSSTRPGNVYGAYASRSSTTPTFPPFPSQGLNRKRSSPGLALPRSSGAVLFLNRSGLLSHQNLKRALVLRPRCVVVSEDSWTRVAPSPHGVPTPRPSRAVLRETRRNCTRPFLDGE